LEVFKDMNNTVDHQILEARFRKLGWTSYRLAQEVTKVREVVFGEKIKHPKHLVTTIDRLLKDPNASSFKNVEAAIRAMGGEVVIRWENREEVVSGYEEVRLVPRQ
jgi:hypothetical protein